MEQTNGQKSSLSSPNRSSNEFSGSALTSKSVTFKRSKASNTNATNLEKGIKDVTLIVDNKKLSAHKSVLASSSDYFDRMFTSSFKERDQDKIEINITDVSFETLSTLVDFFYTSTLVITEHNVQDILIGSNIFLLEDIREACVDYLKCMIDAENCINMKDFANSLGLNELYSLCLDYIIHNFRLVANSREFMTVTYDEIILFIKDDNLFAKEDMVYDVVMDWVKYDPVTRSKYSTELLWYVRLPLVLNTYQGVIKVHEFQGARINGITSFRTEHRKPFRKGILMLSHYPSNSSPEWYDAALDQWHVCICDNCQCKNFQTVLSPPKYLCTSILLDDGRVLTAGGYEHTKGMRTANMFDPLLNQWHILPDMNYERTRPYVVQLGLRIYVIGGWTAEKPSTFSTMEFYELKKMRWVTVKNRFKGLTMLKNETFVTSVDGLIYIIGSNNAGFFNPQRNSWQVIDPLPEKKESAAICTLNNCIYVIGGHDKRNYFKSVWAYCTDTKVWVSVADMNSPRSNSGVTVMNGYIYVFGGKSDNKTYLNTFEVYNPHENEWVTSNAVMNSPRSNIDAIVIEKSSHLFKRVFEDATNNIIH